MSPDVMCPIFAEMAPEMRDPPIVARPTWSSGPGGRRGPILELFGVCVVEQAGTADFELPRPAGMPSFGPIGSFARFGSFVPLFSFDPP
jgi:hypothetical protein